MRKQGLLPQVSDKTWRQEWVVDCRPVGKGETALKYLAPYVFSVALSNKRILKAQDGQVTFRYQDGETKQQRRCTLSAEAFIQRFLQHVLPKGLCQGTLLWPAGAGQSHPTGPSQTTAWHKNR